MVMPGDNISMEVHLIAPIAMDDGLRFAIREGGRRRRRRKLSSGRARKAAETPPQDKLPVPAAAQRKRSPDQPADVALGA